MTFAMISSAVALSLAALFLLSGTAHLAGLRVLRAGYRRGHFSPAFPVVAGVAQLFASLFLAIPETRIWGGVLAATILFVTVVWLLNRGKYLYAMPAILIMMALAPAVAVPV
jgi:hypothetical protein